MKKNIKRTTKVVVAIMAAILMFFVPIGQIVSVADITEEPTPFITEEVLSNAPTEIITTNIGSIVTTVPVTTAITTTTTVETTVTTTTIKITTEKKKVFIFKPETHYVHTKDCYWTECGTIEEITNTEDIEARLCDECCPDIEIMNEYVEPESESESELIIYNYNYSSGEILTPSSGVAYGPSGFETYYNLDMTGVINVMSSYGYSQSDYWVRDDGCKMLGNYIMVAANLDIRPRGTILECSLGPAIVCDTGHFSYNNPYQLDIAVNW